MNEFVNPYKGCVEANNYRRLNADVLKADYDFIRGLRLSNGTIQTTANIVWQKVCNALRERNITTVAQQGEFERFVANSVLVLPTDAIHRRAGTPPSGNTPKTDARDDRRGVKRVCK